MDNDFNRTFTKCPCCGSDSRFFEQLGNELKERGIARDEWGFHLQMGEGVVADNVKEPAVPIGSEFPTYGFITEVCMDCGCVYAIDLRRGNIKKPAPVAAPPNRAMRRRTDKGQEQGPPFSLS